jgi:hypothetical protein
MWEGKDYRKSQIICNWSEAENFCKSAVRLPRDELNAERCKSKRLESFKIVSVPIKCSLLINIILSTNVTEAIILRNVHLKTFKVAVVLNERIGKISS